MLIKIILKKQIWAHLQSASTLSGLDLFWSLSALPPTARSKVKKGAAENWGWISVDTIGSVFRAESDTDQSCTLGPLKNRAEGMNRMKGTIGGQGDKTKRLEEKKRHDTRPRPKNTGCCV